MLNHDHAKGDPSRISIFVKSIGGAVTNVTNAPVKLQGLLQQHIVTTQLQLMRNLHRHYRSSVIRELFKVFGSIDVLGNPSGTFHEVRFGFAQFGKLTYDGELGRGTRALGSYTTSGILGMFFRILRGFGSGLSAISLDPLYISGRKKHMRSLPLTPSDSAILGGKLLVKGVASGVTGPVVKPIQYGVREGGVGVLKGVGRGCVGLFVRPTLGVVDFLSFTCLLSVVNYATEDRRKRRLRPVRFVEPDGIIRPYDQFAALGNSILETLHDGRYYSTYVDHVHTERSEGRDAKRT